MEKNPTILTVVALALIDAAGRVLVQQRPAHRAHGGLWEFPGGKLEPGESPETALVRELDEELGIVAEELAPFTFVSFGYPDFHLVMLLYWCRRWQGQPHGRDGQALRWERPGAMAALPMPPADVPLVEALVAAIGA